MDEEIVYELMGSQTPFLTVNLYINEVKEEDKRFLADIIEEVFKQRIKGFKDRYGNWVQKSIQAKMLEWVKIIHYML